MDTDVIIKANSHGIRIIFHNDDPLEQLLVDIKEKLQHQNAFLKKEGKISVSFEGRELSREEIAQILFAIRLIFLRTGQNTGSPPLSDIQHMWIMLLGMKLLLQIRPLQIKKYHQMIPQVRMFHLQKITTCFFTETFGVVKHLK